MSETLQFKQSRDLHPSLTDPGTGTLNAHKLTGRWLNTDLDTEGLAQITIKHDGNEFSVSALGVGADGPIEWPATRARPLANLEEEGGQRALALAADFELGFMRAETYLRVNKGVLVIVLYNTFRDGSGRQSYLTREFFYRQI
jgi:hypothetical protein